MITLINLNKEKKEKLVFDKPGKYVIFFHNLSGKFTFSLLATGINVDIYGVFIGRRSDEFRVETTQLHKAPGATSNLFIKGVFDEDSKFIYSGLIKIEKEAQKSHAYQKNQNLVLSSKSFIESKPYLEILANDVFCTHGSTTGKLNEEELYYLQARGIDKKRAQKVLIDGFISEVGEKIREKIPEFSYNYA